MDKIFLVLVSVLMLAACGRAPQEEGCLLAEENRLEDADFSLEAQSNRSKFWTGIQHAGEKSFAVGISDAIISIEKVGSQPWFLYRQRMRADDLAGQKIAFSAEVRLVERATDVAEREGRPGGIKLAVLAGGGSRFYLGQRLESDRPPEEWQSLQIIAQLRPTTETLELSFLHESDGVLQVRRPSLRLVDPVSIGCKVTAAPKKR